MSKETLNLSVEKDLKQRAKNIAKKKGISVSRFFEEVVAAHEEPGDYSPAPGSAAYNIYQIIPESQKTDFYDYKKRKKEALKEKYGL